MTDFPASVDTILIVEDDPAVRHTLHRLLNEAGYLVVATGDPDHACELLDDCVIHALVLDVRLSNNRSGLEVLACARAQHRTSALPAIILTGVDLSVEEEGVIRDHGAHLFQKPANIHELLQFLAAHLQS